VAAGRQLKADTFTLLDVKTVAFDRHVEIRLVGELDIDTAGPFRQALRRAHDQGAATVVVDLSGLTFIDSTGLHELVVAQKRQQACGGEIILQSPTAHIRRVVDIVGLNRVFTVR
jgi:anti-sigma B factor antagonist